MLVRKAVCIVCGLLLTFGFLTRTDLASAAGTPLLFRVGAAKIDITPPADALKTGDSIRDHLYVRAIVISNGNTCAVLISADQALIATATIEDALQRASKGTGCPKGNFIVSATHTHSGNTGGLAGSGLPTSARVAQAIVEASSEAMARRKPAHIGYGTAPVHLNINRDLFEGNRWYQGVNREGVSDKTLSVLEMIGADDLPIAVYLNYAMHPINYYLSGLISSDFPGEASGYIERRYPDAVALFSQGASGDQNPLLARPFLKLIGVHTRVPEAAQDGVSAADGWKVFARAGSHPTVPAIGEAGQSAVDAAAYRVAVTQVDDIVKAEGAVIGETAIDVMRNLTPVTHTAGLIRSANQTITCPGRDRLDETAREGVLPPYRAGDPVQIRVGLLRIGDINLSWVNGEVYSAIAMRLKKLAPSNHLAMVTLANGWANSGYIYSNEAASHLTFQVIGSRLEPDCAEDKIVAGVLSMLAEADGAAP